MLSPPYPAGSSSRSLPGMRGRRVVYRFARAHAIAKDANMSARPATSLEPVSGAVKRCHNVLDSAGSRFVSKAACPKSRNKRST